MKREISICEECLVLFEKLKGHKIDRPDIQVKNYDYKKNCLFCKKLTTQYLEIAKKRKC
jgi:hypothetical protein